jgi:hypothetical protein
MDKKKAYLKCKSDVRKQRRLEGLHPDRPLKMQGSLELLEGNAINEAGEDSEGQEDVPEFSHRQKRRSNNKSSGSRSHGNDDMTGEPTRLDTGEQKNGSDKYYLLGCYAL